MKSPQESESRPRAQAGDGASEPTAGRLILIVEDDEAFAAILAEIAQERGFEVALAGTAEEGVALARSRRPAAMLLDVGLPDHSGLTVLERLKRDPATRHIPVHVISLHDHVHQALELGAVGYAMKPAAREVLEGAFSTLTDRLERQPRRVLVVEDDPLQQESLRVLLGSDGVEIVTVGTAADALQELREGGFDCVVLDLGLPDAGGEELLRQLAAEELPLRPPVVVYTGRELSPAEEARIRQRTRSIVVKGARSPERLLDEVTLFVHRVESELPLHRRRMLAQVRSRDAALEGRTLLLAEDDVRSVFAITAALEPHGVRVEIARNGEEALAALDRTPSIDLVLMDIMMPIMDGYEAIRRLRADPRFAGLPVIALTARAMKDDRERCLAAGSNDYLAKPIDVDRLVSLIRVWLPSGAR